MRIILTHFLLIGAAFGNYAGKKGNPTAVLPKHPGPKIVNPSNPIDPSRVKTIDPSPFGGRVVDNIPPFVHPPVVDSQIVGREADVFGLHDQRRPFPNELVTDVVDPRDHRPPFRSGPRPDAFDLSSRKSPSFENLHKVPIGGPDQDPFDFSILDPHDYGKSVPRPGIVDPHVVDQPIQKSQTYEKAQKGPAIDNVLANPGVKSGYDNPHKRKPGLIDPHIPPIHDKARSDKFNNHRLPVRKSSSYENSKTVLIKDPLVNPAVKKPGEYSDPHITKADIINSNEPFDARAFLMGGYKPNTFDPSQTAGQGPDVFVPIDGPGTGAFDPRFPRPTNRKSPSYDNSHLKNKPGDHIPDVVDPRDQIPPIGKPPGYSDPSAGHVPDVFHPSGGPVSDGFDPRFPSPPIRKAPSYDNTHLKDKPVPYIPDEVDPRDPIPPIGKPPGYSDPSAGHVPDVFHPSGGPVSDGFDPRFPDLPIRKTPSYDNAHLKDKPVRHIPDVVDPSDPIPSIGKPPGYSDPSTGHVPDVFHPSGGPVSDGFDPRLPDLPIRKAPSYDNTHLKDKPISQIPDVVDPRDPIPPKGKLPGYSDPFTGPGPDVFHPSGGPVSDGFDPRIPRPPIRKAPSYDNTHLKNKPNRHISDIVDPHVPIAPIGKPPGLDDFHPSGRSRSDGFDPRFSHPPIRKAPSYDNSHLKDKQISHIPDIVDPRDPVLPIRKSPGYSDPSTGPGPDIFHPIGTPRSDGFDPRFPVPPIRKAPSYDNTHLKNKPGSRIPDVVDPRIPIPPIGKPPGYSDPSTGPGPDVFHPSGGPISDGFDPRSPGQPIRKAPSYDNAHLKNKPVSHIPDVVDPFAPHIPKQKPGYDKLREKPLPVIPGHGDRFGNVGPGIDPIKKTGYGNAHLGKEGRDPLRQKPGGYERTKVKKAGISQIDNPVHIPRFGGQDELSSVIDANLRQGIRRGDQLPHEQVGALRLPERLKIPPSRPVLPPKRTYSKKKRRYLSTLKKKWLRN